MGDWWDTIAGTADHLAGSTDESVARQFDDVEGGGFADEWGSLLDPTGRASEQTEQDAGDAFEWWSALTGNAGYLLTDVDESWGRQFDDVEGGGFADEAGEAAADAADEYTPAWLRWVLDHQEETVLLLVLLAFAWATNGTVGVGGGSSG